RKASARHSPPGHRFRLCSGAFWHYPSGGRAATPAAFPDMFDHVAQAAELGSTWLRESAAETTANRMTTSFDSEQPDEPAVRRTAPAVRRTSTAEQSVAAPRLSPALVGGNDFPDRGADFSGGRAADRDQRPARRADRGRPADCAAVCAGRPDRTVCRGVAGPAPAPAGAHRDKSGSFLAAHADSGELPDRSAFARSALPGDLRGRAADGSVGR